MKFQLDKCNIVGIVPSSSNPGTLYIEVRTLKDQFNFSVRDHTVEELEKFALEPVKISGTFSGRVYRGSNGMPQQSLSCSGLRVEPTK